MPRMPTDNIPASPSKPYNSSNPSFHGAEALVQKQLEEDDMGCLSAVPGRRTGAPGFAQRIIQLLFLIS